MQPTLKAELRQHVLHRRDQLAPAYRAWASAVICEQVAALPFVQAAQVVHGYLSFRSEVDTLPLLATLLARGQQVIVPIVARGTPDLAHSWLTSCAPADLTAGVYGTPQPRQPVPAPVGAWQLTLVPLVAFCRRGYRLGYGKGYYDRMLAAHPTPTIGLAFAVQAVAVIPAEAHDWRLDWIVTEQEVLAVP